MFGHRLRRWPSITPEPDKRLFLASDTGSDQSRPGRFSDTTEVMDCSNKGSVVEIFSNKRFEF